MQVFNAADYPQLSPAWWSLRCGVPTASSFSRIITAKTRKASAQQEGYAAELAGDLACQSPAYFTRLGRPINKNMEYGRDLEGEARRFYEQDSGIKVWEVGFLKTDDGRFGCSPDFMIGDEAVGELKCPMAKTHAQWLLKNELPLEHMAQVHGEIIVSGLTYCMFMSYCPPMPPLKIKVVQDDFTLALRVQLKVFWDKFTAIKERLGVIMPNQPDEINPEIAQAVAAYQERLAELDKADIEDALASVNSWLDEIKDEKAKRPMVAVNIWRTVKRYADQRQWHFDEVNRMFRKEESVGF